MFDNLKNKILSKKAKIGIVGLGYVGLPLAIAFARKGFKVWGIDVDKDRVTRLKKGQSYLLDLKPSEITTLQKDGSFIVTSDISHIKKLDAFIICVPTPLLKTKEPDVSFIVSATEMIKKHVKNGQIVVLESTTYPGTTEEVMLPILESTGLKESKDFYLAFSPERIDPGNTKYFVTNIPKVVGGLSKRSTDIVALLYSQIIEKLTAELNEYKAKSVMLDGLSYDNEKLRAAMSFRARSFVPRLLAAEVIGRSGSNWFSVIEINRGSLDNVIPDSAVLNEEGLVGRVFEVSQSSSKVMLITDPSSAVSALDPATGDMGIAAGNSVGPLKIQYMSATAAIKEGDKFTTSGMSDIFPKGIVIGTVRSTSKKDYDIFQKVDVDPAVNFSKLNKVFVIAK